MDSLTLIGCAVRGVAVDRRFATAYNAALLSANKAIARAGYRVAARMSHHKVPFASAALALGPSAADFVDYFKTCRRKRNLIDYTRAEVATELNTSRAAGRTPAGLRDNTHRPLLSATAAGPSTLPGAI